MRLFRPSYFFVLLALAFGPSTGRIFAQSPDQIENSRQTRRSWVSDNADVLSDAEERRISAVCAELEKRSGAELEVVTVQSLGGKPVRDYANELAATLKIGKKDRDNGVLLLNAVEERQVSIRVGYGIEGVLPDGKTAEIKRSQIAPFLARKDYATGLYNGALAIAQVIDPTMPAAPAANSAGGSSETLPAFPEASREDSSGTSDFPVTNSPARSNSRGTFGSFALLSGLLIFLFPLIIIGGLVWFFTGVMRRPLRCSKCRAPVQQLSDTAELASLSPVQQFEQQIGARDYRVWHCQNCQHEDITAHDLPGSQFVQCPTCHHQTASSLVETVRQPTHRRGGQERVILTCQWPGCKHSNFYNRLTPAVPRGGYGNGYGGGYRRGNSGTDLLTGIVLGSLLNGGGRSGGDWGNSNNDSGGFGGGFDSGSSGGFDSGPSDFGGGDFGGGGSDGGY